MDNENNCYKLEFLLNKLFVSIGYKITRCIESDPVPESSKYYGQVFSLDHKKIIYRKGKITKDRPGAFLSVWKRGGLGEIRKPIPLQYEDLDFLFIYVSSNLTITNSKVLENELKSGMFIFPVETLIEKGIINSITSKGKTGFRVFPPWSDDRGSNGTKMFSNSGKKTQRWQLPYYFDMNLIDTPRLLQIMKY
jgi:hypothetical protein